MRILIIDDEAAVTDFIRKGFREASYDVDAAADGITGFEKARTLAYDAIVLDLMLPGKDGFQVVRDLRAAGITTPIICLTARDHVDDRIKGLDSGADDYLSKPFAFAELLARVRALLRRGQVPTTRPIVVGDLRLDVIERSAIRATKKLELSRREYSLLEYLMRNAGQILTRAMILEHVWDMRQDPLTNVVDVHINRLRKKVDHGFAQPLIHTIHGVGYVIDDKKPA